MVENRREVAHVPTDLPPPPGRQVAELHAWIATNPDGSESIMATGVALVAGARIAAERLRPYAEHCAELAAEVGRPCTFRLVAFRRVDGDA